MSRIALTNANVLDGEHAARPASTVVVEGGRIVELSDDAAPSADEVVDCAGLTLMPGMTQGHFHSTYHNLSAASLPIGFEAPPAYQAYMAAHNAGLALRSGFTTVIGATEPWDISLSLKKAIVDGLVTGPRVIVGSREVITTADSTDTIPWYWEAQSLASMRPADGPDEWRKAVRTEIKRGAEIVKTFATGGHGTAFEAELSSVTQAELDAAVEAAHNLGRRVRSHAASLEGVTKCLDAGVDIIDHGDGIDDECIKRMAEQGVCYVPSAYVHKVYSDDRGELDLDGPWGRVVVGTCEAVRKCVDAGVTVVLGDDYGSYLVPHGSYGRELNFWHKYTGLSELEILKWATVNGATMAGEPDYGRIAEGYVADLILVRGDPSVNIESLAEPDNVVSVMRDGKFLIDNRNAYRVDRFSQGESKDYKS